MILGSKEIFIPKYIDGTKKHSIREGERWNTGMTIHYYGKVRQPGMYKFMEDSKCKSTQRIFMTFNGYAFEITVDNKYLYYPEKLLLANNDGFENPDQMCQFFFPKYTGNLLSFSGQIVHWTDLKY